MFPSGSVRIHTETFQPIEKKMIDDQLIVLEPNNPVMIKIQKTLKQHLLKQKDIIKQEIASLVSVIIINCT